MNKQAYIDEIKNIVVTLDIRKLKEISDYAKYIKFKESIDPTLEIIESEDSRRKIEAGLQDIEHGRVHEWNSVK
mgnify:CR=1 FL=1